MSEEQDPWASTASVAGLWHPNQMGFTLFLNSKTTKYYAFLSIKVLLLVQFGIWTSNLSKDKYMFFSHYKENNIIVFVTGFFLVLSPIASSVHGQHWHLMFCPFVKEWSQTNSCKNTSRHKKVNAVPFLIRPTESSSWLHVCVAALCSCGLALHAAVAPWCFDRADICWALQNTNTHTHTAHAGPSTHGGLTFPLM